MYFFNEISVKPTLQPQAVLQDGQPAVAIGREKDAWKITNPVGGGIFAVSLSDDKQTWRVNEKSKFDADFSLSREAKVDLYFTIDGVRHVVEMNGEQRADASVRKLGNASFPKVSTPLNPNWRPLSFSIGEAIKKMYPQKSGWTISKIEIGALHGDEYRWQGFFGNPLGASYLLKNATLTEN